MDLHNRAMVPLPSSLIHMAAVGGLALLASCVAPPARPPAAPPAIAAAPAVPVPVATNWHDWPIASGSWSYQSGNGASVASFGMTGQAPLLAIRCNMASRQISVALMGKGSAEQIVGQMTVHTSFGDAQWPVTADFDQAMTPLYAVATRAAVDTIFDRIAFSRGRFAIEAPGAEPIAVPNWAEPSRVIEDCRG